MTAKQRWKEGKRDFWFFRLDAFIEYPPTLLNFQIIHNSFDLLEAFVMTITINL